MARVSRFGQYSGYSTERYSQAQRQSEYFAVRDGVPLGADVFLPVGAVDPMPVVLIVTRYWRAKQTETGGIYTMLGRLEPGHSIHRLNTEPVGFHEPVRQRTLHTLLAHGYAVVVVENRGTGVSFGVMDSVGGSLIDYMQSLGHDVADAIAWCAGQPWSNGRVAMWGGSWLGWMQLAGAAMHPPALTAIFPRVASAVHTHRLSHFGGLFFKGAMVTMGKTMVRLAAGEFDDRIDGERIVGPPPVDDDPEGLRRDAARAGHGSASFASYFETTLEQPAARELFDALGITEPGDKLDLFFNVARLDQALANRPDLRQRLLDIHFYDHPDAADWAVQMHERVSASGTPAYFWDGWRDAHPHDRLVQFTNHRAPKRLTIGPWCHGPFDPYDQREKEAENLIAVESLRWFDRWTKQVDNGIDQEPPLAFAVERAGPSWTWRHTETWPRAGQDAVMFHLGGDGPATLSRTAATQFAEDKLVTDYAATSGTQTTYHSVAGGGPIDLPDMSHNDSLGLTYTTAPLTADLTVVGSPVITLHVTADTADAVVVVHIEEVLENGRSELVKQGFVRASHRALRELPYDNLGVPFFSSLRADVDAAAPLSDGIAELVIATEPMAHVFSKGSRVRLTITGADEGVLLTIPQVPPPVVTVLSGPAHPSRVEVSVLPGD